MAESTSTIGKKVKALANPLRDEGIGSGDYLEQITYLVFIKMVDEYSKPPYNRPVNIPQECTWDELVKDGTIENMNKDFYVDMNLLADYGQVWMDEFTAYAHSARGLFNTIQEFSADIVEQATQRLSSVVSNDDVKKVTDIAQEWGLNNDVPQA